MFKKRKRKTSNFYKTFSQGSFNFFLHATFFTSNKFRCRWNFFNMSSHFKEFKEYLCQVVNSLRL